MLICREVADGANVTDENGTRKMVTLLILASVGYFIWQEYQKQSAPAPIPTAATVATTTGKAGEGADINALVHTAI